MKKIIQFVILLLVIAICPLAGQTQKIPEDIVLSLKAGNAEELASHFHNNVELIILEKEDVYSRTQAEQIIRKFFLDHPPRTFKIIFEGGKEHSHYAIGSLTTYKVSYRVYLLMKKQNGKSLIHQLRIEEEAGNDQ